MRRPLTLLGCLGLVGGLSGCGNSSSPVSMTVATYQPVARDSGYFAKKSGWKSNEAQGGKAADGKPDVTPSPRPTPDDPDPSDPGPTPDPEIVVSNDPLPMTPAPLPLPDPMPDPQPVARAIPDESVRLEPTPENLFGTWRGETQHYKPEKEQWTEDGQFFTARFFESTDEEGNQITAVQISQEVDGRLVPAPATPARIDYDTNYVRFNIGIAPIQVRIVEDGLLEVTGRESNFLVVRYFKRVRRGN